MKNMKNLSKRALVLLLVLSMCMGMLPTTAFAAEAEHTHNEDGWTCTQETTRELTCKAHVHGEDCYETKQGELTCEADEHTHGDDCYAVETTLDCTEAEHTHGDGCYEEDELTCEAGEHSHGDSCYVTETVTVCTDAEHTHGDGCYETVTELACTEDGHEHDDGCYTVTEGKWTCVAPETPKADADDADEADETDEADEAALPAEVQYFVAAMKVLPEEVTEDNLFEVASLLLDEDVEDAMYAAKNYLGVPEVAAAYAKYNALGRAMMALMGVEMYGAGQWEGKDAFWVKNDGDDGDGFWTLVSWLNSKSNSELTIYVEGNVTFSQTLTITNNNTVKVYNWGDDRRALRNGSFPLFAVENGGSLTIGGSLTLDGNGQDDSLLVVLGGQLTLGEDVKVQNVNNTNGHGGGVYVHNGGTLTINGGVQFSNCFAKENSGNVYVAEGGKFYNNANLTNGVVDANPKSGFAAYTGDHARVYLTINAQAVEGLPGEPSVVEGTFIWTRPDSQNKYGFQQSAYAIVGKDGDPATILDARILNDLTPSIVAGDQTLGVFNKNGAELKDKYIHGVDWDTLLKQLSNFTEYSVPVLGPNGTRRFIAAGYGEQVSDLSAYEIVPYVIKYQPVTDGDNDKIGWHIDCMVVPKNRVEVTYDPNLPDVTIAGTFEVPGREIGYGRVTLNPVAWLKYDGNNVASTAKESQKDPYVTEIPATYNGRAVTLKFLGWATSPEDKVWGQPNSYTYFEENTQLYAQWEVTNPSYQVQWLAVDKDGNETAIKDAETRWPTLTELQKGKVSVKDADKATFTQDGVTYEFDKSVTEGKLNDKDLVIKLYFKVPTADYTVQWLTKDKDGNDVPPLKTATRTGNVGATVEVTEADKTFTSEDGKITYEFDGSASNILSATLAESGTVLKLYFKVPASQLKDLQARYLVQWIDGNTVVKFEVRGPEAMGTEVEVTDADKEDFTEGGKNYTLDKTAKHVEKGTLKAIAGPDDIVTLKLYFVAQYTVTYSWTGLPEGHGKTLPTGGSYTEGTEVTVNSTYTNGTEATVGGKTYVFSGWDKSNFTMPAENVEIKGSWSEKTYTVTYSWTGLPEGHSETLPTGGSYTKDAEVTVNSTYTKGTEATVGGKTYVFSGWDKSNFAMPAEDVEIKGSWSEKTYTVTYGWTGLPEDHGKTLPTGGSYTAGANVTVDSTYTSTSTVKVGDDTYKFSGWKVPDDITVTDGKFAMPGNNVVIDGVWVKTVPAIQLKLPYFVKWLDADGNELKSESRGPEAIGTKVSVTEADKVIAGYTFDENAQNVLSGELKAIKSPDDIVTLKLYFKAIEYAAAAENVEAVYDGKAHPVTKVTFTKDGVAVSADAGSISITYATMARSAVDGAPKDAGWYTATITAKIDGFDVSATATVTITPATLTVTTYSDSKTYNGTALTAGGKVEGLVNGETVTLNVTGSQTKVGSSTNSYELVWNGTAKEDNYTVTATLGTLTVNKKDVPSGGGNGGGNEPDPDPDPKPDPDPVDPTPVDPDPVDPTPVDPEDPTVDIDDPDVPLAENPTVDIDEPDVPLAELPGADDSLVEIPDLEVPLADVPKTGDLSIFWYMTTLLSAMGLMVLAVLERRQRREK